VPLSSLLPNIRGGLVIETLNSWFRVRIGQPCDGKPKSADLFFGERLVASASFTYWRGIGKIAIYDEAEFVPPDARRNIQAFLREWGKSAVMARLEYANDQAELNKES
jgi:hypothetical protein